MGTVAINELIRKRSELSGVIDRLTKQIESARTDLVHIDGALQALGFEDPSTIKAKNLAQSARLFKRGELYRFILDSLRVAPEGLTQAQICQKVMQQKGWDQSDRELEKRLKHRLNNNLTKLLQSDRVQRGPMVGRNRLYRILIQR